jgi:hypothetical protein
MLMNKYSRFGFKKIALIYIMIIALLVSPFQSAHALTIEDINHQAMNFGTPTLTSGTANSVNAIYKFENIFSTTVDANVTIAEISANATLSNFDSGSSNVERFNPIMGSNSSGSGYVNFKIEFVDKSGNPVFLKNFFMTAVDLDGKSSSVREYNEVSGYKEYIVNDPTGLTIGAGLNGRTKFTGLGTSVDGIPFQDNDSFIANYSAPISTLNVVVGVTGASSDQRQFSINFGAAGGVFTTPVTVQNPQSPTITVSIDDGGDGHLKPGIDTLGAVPISGTTTTQDGQTIPMEGRTVTISVTDSANQTSNFTAVVQSGGTYSLTPDLSALASGPITVTANVVSQDGNPANPATDTSNIDYAPTATSVNITGTAKVGQTVTGTYTYADVESDLQGTSTFKWYSGTQSDGSDKVAISGVTGTTYTSTNAEYGKYLFFEVTPIAQTGTTTGAPVVSSIGPIGDEAPTATSVGVTGTAMTGQTLTGEYTYGDVDGNAEGTTTFKWYSGTQSDGSDKVAIGGATGHTYTVTNAVYGKYIFFEVTPVAAAGTPTGTPVLSSGSGPAGDVAPTATSVSVTGTAKVGQAVTGGYTYGDVDGDLQGTSTFKWYSGTQSNGSDKVAISGATGTTYTPTNTEYGKYLFFEVTPVAQTGTPTGTPAVSSGSGPVVDVAPTATSVSITGTSVVGQTLTGVYTYGDADGDLQGVSTFKWYSGSQSDGSDKVAISGATNPTYTITNAEYGKNLFFEVTPVATTGTPTGEPASSSGVKVNMPPVVQDITKTGLVGAVINFSLADFSVGTAYSDIDGDALAQVQITVPNTFDTQGTLWYESTVSNVVYIAQGTMVTLTQAQLDSLRFKPASTLPNGSTVTFDWKGNDGKQNSEAPALVKIAYNGIPVAQSLVISAEEGTPPITIVLKGSDMESVTGLVYGLASSPLKGTLVPATVNNPNGDKWIYTPNPGFTGIDSFTYTVTDGDSQKSQPATAQIEVNKPLEGWVGSKNQGETTVVKMIPGQMLKLSAISSLHAAEVTATVNGTSVPLTLANAATFATDGFKKWENSVHTLSAGIAVGEYTVAFTAKQADQTLLPAELATKLADNKFEVPGPAVLKLKANPEKILGDGKSTTQLTATLTDANGNPIAGAEVVFSLPTGKGSFVGADRAVTDSQGIAVVTYKSEKITGVNEQKIPVQAIVNDEAKALYGKDQIEVTFLPPSISGVLTKGGTNEPVAGATIRVTLDLNGDGKIEQGVDFDQTVITKADGSYSLAVPEGDKEYNLDVTQTVMIGGVETPVTYKQKANVGSVAGAGGESFDSEKTVTGMVLFKKPDGQSSLFSSDLVDKMKVYLKDPAGNYILENGVPKGFPLQGQGVFQAEGLIKGVDYTMEIRYEYEPGKEIAMKSSTVRVTADGEMNILQELVDPYGTIRDAITKNIIVGAEVTLFYADTQRNRDKGIAPNTTVILPAVSGFAPYDNKSPIQLSDPTGFYAYMVFPQTDYYLTVTKPGYIAQKSENISVEFDIVKRDFELMPIRNNPPSGGGGGGSFTPLQPDVTLTVTADKNLVKEGDQSTITVDYKNPASSKLEAGEIKIKLPKGAELVNAGGGTVDGDTITWKVSNVAAGEAGSFKFEVKWPLLTSADTEFEFPGEFIVNGTAENAVKATSTVKVKVFSDRFGLLSHQRYILGYPDGEFKPNNFLTRAEIAAAIARLTENVTINEPLPYNDIQEGHWAANYVKIATKHGYFSGFEDGGFHPESVVTRGELAAVMARFLKLNSGTSGDNHFTDVQGHWAAGAIEDLYRGHFLSGYPDGTFKPQDSILRVEAVTLINRMLYRGPLKGMDSLFPDITPSHWGYGDVLEATYSHESVRNEDGSETWKNKIEDHVQ